MKHTNDLIPVTRRWIPVISVLVIALFTAALWAASEEWKAPSFRARKKNPIAADARSIAVGKTLYIQECLSCHGSTGRGDGSAAKDLDIPPGDLTAANVASQSDGALFWKISTGRSPMPTFETLMSVEQRWQVVNYIRTLAARVPVTVPRYDSPDLYRRAVSAVVDPYLVMTEYMAGDNPDLPTSQAKLLAKAVSDLEAIDAADLPGVAREPWQELTQSLRLAVEKLVQAQDTDSSRLQLKAVSGSLTGLVQAFGHAQDAPLVLLDCDLSFDKAGASWVQTEGPPRNPYVESDKDRDCGRVVARLAAEVGNDHKPPSQALQRKETE